MARTKTLGQMVVDLRNELGMSTDPAQSKNNRGAMVRTLQRVQETLYLEYDWPFLKVRPSVSLKAGARYYDIPSDLSLERISSVDVQWSGQWLTVARGITADHYAALESEQTPAETSFTVNSGANAFASGGFTINAGTLGGSNVISQVSVDGTNLLSASVPWTTSHSSTARNVVTAINARTATTGYAASAVGAVVTITADPDDGASANGRVVSVTVGGTVTVTSVTNMASGANNKVSSIKVDGIDILGTAVGYRTSTQATATAIAARINETVTRPAYTATAAGNEVTIASDPNSTTTGNDLAVVVATTGTLAVSTPADMSGGIISDRADPVQAWDVASVDGAEQIEVWPVPASNDMTLRIHGYRALADFAVDADYCTLDANLIVLFAAAELAAASKSPRAKMLASAAGAHVARLKGRVKGGTGRRLNMAGEVDMRPDRTDRIRVAYAR